jgi:hypothetical protein
LQFVAEWHFTKGRTSQSNVVDHWKPQPISIELSTEPKVYTLTH